ncbi:MAG: L-rhamnose mutarotase [Ferroplasma sp.]|uniref:L-rhamnose mutarotase n=1 Tax=Ferroplasma sp. TaxID=2591003 RepID=UPI00281652F7|nr:L-rhamnose mutarotase [Ferroplasma sp.]WMT51145.1 MAG: L-rhamnose mutarotase [Ferroplasma sp.]
MRYSFHLIIRDEMKDEYIKRHNNVWPELLKLLKEAGVRNYSIFMDGADIFGYWECEDLSRTLDIINCSEINRKWQDFMSDVIITAPESRTRDTVTEVFHLD